MSNSSIQTGFQRVENRSKNFMRLKKRINKYVHNLSDKKQNELRRCYISRNNVDFNRLNRINMPKDFRTPAGNDCFKRALDIKF
tara:strand:- start:204 stop:455 length:252 start_codon:yes stop_codon:yes gene_type:complete